MRIKPIVRPVLTALLAATLGVSVLGAPAHAATPGPVVTEADGFDQECTLNTGQITHVLDTYSDIWWFAFYLNAVNAAAWNTGDCPVQASNTSASSIEADANTGIGLVPIYAGLQDPCFNSGNDFSTDQSTANAQGQSAAGTAWDEAEALGFPKNVYIYYDLEGYDTSDATCVSAAGSFLAGWDSEMESLGGHPAVYGSACSSDLSSFASISPVPEAIWPAWYSDPSHTSVYNVTCISNGYWNENQRLVQWTDSGALSANGTSDNDSPVDFDCADGPAMDIKFGPGVTLPTSNTGCKGTQ
jgi:hypothetical protein